MQLRLPAALGRALGQCRGPYVALHGTGRFVAQGWFERKDPTQGERPKDHAFTTYGFVELFDVLGVNQDKGEDFAHDIRRRVHLYFTLVNILLVAAAVGLFYWHLNWSQPLAVEPMVRASAILPEQVTDAQLQAQARATGDTLRQRLLEQAALQRPSLVVAASGGGTRAAVYTAVALEGMAQIDRATRRGVVEWCFGRRRFRRGVRQPLRQAAQPRIRAMNPRSTGDRGGTTWIPCRSPTSRTYSKAPANCASRAVHRSVCCCRKVSSAAPSRPPRRASTRSRKLATPGFILNTADQRPSL